MTPSKTIRIFSLIIATLFCTLAPIIGYLKIGWPPVIIVGGSAITAFIFWYFTYLRNPVKPALILPLFIFTVAALQVHITEEYLTGFGPAMSRLFAIPWSERSFLMIFALVGPTLYTLTTYGLYKQIPLAGFVAWFIFIGPGVAEFTHYIFPLIPPGIDPAIARTISQDIKGTLIENMPNYYYKTTGHYYFAGMYTAILPMIPGSYAIYRLTKEYRKSVDQITSQ